MEGKWKYTEHTEHTVHTVYKDEAKDEQGGKIGGGGGEVRGMRAVGGE